MNMKIFSFNLANGLEGFKRLQRGYENYHGCHQLSASDPPQGIETDKSPINMSCLANKWYETYWAYFLLTSKVLNLFNTQTTFQTCFHYF